MRLSTAISTIVLAALAAAATAQPGGLPAFDRPEDRQVPAAQITLKVGDPAPPLTVFKWYSGTPVAAFESGKVYVVEFFISENAPTTRNIAAMNALQVKYKDRGVQCIGISAEEGGLRKVERMAARLGDRLAYTVGYDDRRQTFRNWITASGRRDYPACFLVGPAGKIVWSGRSMYPWGELEDVIASVLDGTYSAEKAAQLDRKWNERKAQLQLHLDRLTAAVTAGKGQGAMTVIDELIALDPSMASELALIRFNILLQQMNDPNGAYKHAAEAIAGPLKDDEAGLNIIAYTIATTPNLEPRDLDLALKAAERALLVTGERDFAVLDALAAVHFARNEFDKAIDAETKAVSLADDPASRSELEATLKKYRDAKSAGQPG